MPEYRSGGKHAEMSDWLTSIASLVIERHIGADPAVSDASAAPGSTPASRRLRTQWNAMEPYVESLVQRQRLVVELRFRDGMRYGDIADRLGIPIGTVRSRLARARVLVARLSRASAEPTGADPATPAPVGPAEARGWGAADDIPLDSRRVRSIRAALGGPDACDAAAVPDRGTGLQLLRPGAIAGDALVAVILHGSWARGDATPRSAVDLLFVVDPRVVPNRQWYREWDARPVTWQGRVVNPRFVHPPSEGILSGLWAETAIDGIVFLDRDRRISATLAGIRRAIANGRFVRRVVHGQPYWAEAV